jgi:2'-phosphotransferase
MDLSLITCAGFVMKTLDNKIIFVKTPNNKYSFPKGKYEKKKDCFPKNINNLYNCACRELIEETQMFNYTFATTKDTNNCYVEKTNILYFPSIITNLNHNFIINFNSNDELEELRFLSLDEISLLSDNEIKPERKKIAINHLLNNGDIFNVNKYNKMQTISNQTLSNQTLGNQTLGNQTLDNQTFGQSILNQQMNKQKETSISKKMSYYLRHHINEISHTVTQDGYVKLSDLLKHKDFVKNNITKSDIEYIVINNDKQRFKLIMSDTCGELMIRANQGHSNSESNISEQIDQTKIYTEIIEPLPYCVHGTTRKAINEIKKTGLNKMSRTHIHFASEHNAKSGFRTSSTVLIHIDMLNAMTDGIKFFISENGVILSEGPIDPKYFSKIQYV